MTAKVKRCPFCNGHNLTMERGQIHSSVKCYECGAIGPHSLRDERAVELWNGCRRVNPNALVCKRSSNHHELKEVDLE